MYVPDLETSSPIAAAPWVRTVGWLARDAYLPSSSSSRQFRERLRALCARSFESAEALGWPVAAGIHLCELCGNYSASGNLGVPGSGVLYIAPEMIGHYVDSHDYAPPAEFVAAVLRCPAPGTPEYATAVEDFARRT